MYKILVQQNKSCEVEICSKLRVQGAKIGLKINVKKTKSLRLGISEEKGDAG